MRPTTSVVAVLVALVAAVPIVTGLWAMIAPESFFVTIAPYPPYSRHLLHDIGAFELGLGGCLVLGVFVRDALLAVLGGNAIGGTAHFLSHVIARTIGGHASDPVVTGMFALVLILLTVARWWTFRRVLGPGRHRVTKGDPQ